MFAIRKENVMFSGLTKFRGSAVVLSFPEARQKAQLFVIFTDFNPQYQSMSFAQEKNTRFQWFQM